MTVDFVVHVIVRGKEGATAEAARRAFERMIAGARQLSPDRRFDWGMCHVQAERKP